MVKRIGKGQGRRAQMQISFGMIFSIILIIVFVAFAFFGIKKFVEVQQSASISQFKSDFQNDVTNMWNGPQGQQKLQYNLPKKVSGVCITKNTYENLYFLPRTAGFTGADISHIDLNKISKDLCFENKDGVVSITLKKDFGETLVTVLN